MRYVYKQNSGFSLIEISVIVVIVGIITTLAIAGFTKTIAHQKLNGEIGRAISTMRYITDEARVSKQIVTVFVDFDNELIFAWVDKNENGTYDTGEDKIDDITFDTGIDLVAGKLGGTTHSDQMQFLVYGDGSPDLDVRIAIFSPKTEEYRGLIVKELSGWVEEYEFTYSELGYLKGITGVPAS